MTPWLSELPILILSPHSRCNCRCLMCDIWKSTDRAEITPLELERHLDAIDKLAVEWVVLSGGEPLMHSDLFRLCALLRSRHLRVTLLTTGLLLERYAEQAVTHLNDVVVSLDGPREVHDRIRRVPGAFDLMQRGILALHDLKPDFPVYGRSTIQRPNHACVRLTAQAAKQASLASLSFLAADVTSQAFNRPGGWNAGRQAEVALSEPEIDVLEREFHALSDEWDGSGFIVETPEKLEAIVRHFRAHLGLCEPVAPRCNAPWVSAVVEADGTVRPCFFHQPIGSTRSQPLADILNGPRALQFRSQLDVAQNPICQKCVCSLYRAAR